MVHPCSLSQVMQDMVGLFYLGDIRVHKQVLTGWTYSAAGLVEI